MIDVLQECPFCDTLISRRAFIETEDCFVILARHAVHKGQSLVIPKRHVSALNELSDGELSSMMLSVKGAINALKEAGVASDFNVVINDGFLAGQTVQHVHIHLIPRQAGDCVEPKRWLSDRLFELLKEVPILDLEDTALLLRSGLSFATQQNDISKTYTVGSSHKMPSWVKIHESCIIEDGVIFGRNGCADTLDHRKGEIIIRQGAIIRSGTIIYNGVDIGRNFDCGHNVLIRDGTAIGDDVYIYTGAQIHRDVRIGNSCVIGGWLGNGSTVENNVKMFGNLVHKYESERGSVHEPAPVIRSGAFVGWNATVVGGIEIGASSVVGAGSVVVSDVEPSVIMAGNPARSIEGNS